MNEEEYLQAAHQASTDLEPYLPRTSDFKKKQARLRRILNTLSSSSSAQSSSSTTSSSLDDGNNKRIVKWAFSNSIRPHVERMLKHLDIYDCIDGITDYYYLRKDNKPNESAYRIVLAALPRSTSPEQCVFFDDSIANLVAAKKLGKHHHKRVPHQAIVRENASPCTVCTCTQYLFGSTTNWYPGIHTVLVGVEDPSVIRTLPPVDYAITDIHHVDCALRYFGLSFSESDDGTSSSEQASSEPAVASASSVPSSKAVENNHTNHK